LQLIAPIQANQACSRLLKVKFISFFDASPRRQSALNLAKRLVSAREEAVLKQFIKVRSKPDYHQVRRVTPFAPPGIAARLDSPRLR